MDKNKMKKEISSYELDILKMMWRAGKPLSASEIGGSEYEFTHYTIKIMCKKGLVKACDFSRHGDLFEFCYQPTINQQDFEKIRYMYQETPTAKLKEKYIEKMNEDPQLQQLEKKINEKKEKLKKPFSQF